jgi:hypothetical protein
MANRTKLPPRRGAVIGVAAAGVFAGHRLTYLLVSPDPVARDALIHRTGHAYFSFASELASVAALVGLAALVLGRIARRGGPLPGTRELIARFAAFQVLAFVSVEVLERVASAAGLGDLGHVLPIGVAVQLALSLAAGLVLKLMLRGADCATAVLGRAPIPARLRSLGSPARTAHIVCLSAALAAGTIRGPPSAG